MEHTIYEETLCPTLYFRRNLQDYIDFYHVLKNKFQCALGEHSALSGKKEPVFLCIGTDRMTGDCLGPLVGHQLDHYYRGAIPVLGTLKDPVHAQNLCQTIRFVNRHFANPYVIVVDASLGVPDHIGCITLMSGALTPGRGLKKQLPPVGDLSITGIVNSCKGNPSLLLQSTRLHLVNELAEFISTGLMNTLDY